MVKIQIDLDDDEDRIVEVYKAKNRIETKAAAIRNIIRSNRFIILGEEK